MKRLILSLFLFLHLLTNIKAQNCAYFNKDTINSFLHIRLHQIKSSLLEKIISGEINPYINDSLTRKYNLSEFKKRCKKYNEIYVDTIYNVDGVVANFFKSLVFQSTIFNQNNETNLKKLNSIYFISSSGFWVCCFSWQEIKKKLPKNDVLFLSSLYQVKVNDIVQIDTTDKMFYFKNYKRNEANKKRIADLKYNSWNDMFWNNSFHKLSELDICQISTMIADNLWWPLKNEIKENENVFLKDSKYLKSKNDIENDNSDTIVTKKYQNLPGFKDSVIYFIDSNSGNYMKRLINHSIETNIDTMYVEKYYLNSKGPSLLMLGKNEVNTLSLNFKKNYDANYRTTLNWVFIKDRHPQKWLIYFLEEYFKEHHYPIE